MKTIEKLSNLLDISKNSKQFYGKVNTDKNLIAEIKGATQLLEGKPIAERIFYLLHDVSKGVCGICQNPTKFISVTEGYKKYCAKCVRKTPESIAKREATTLERFGVSNVSNLQSMRDIISKKAIEKYSDTERKKEIIEKQTKTCREKYNVDNPAQLDEFKKKAKNTNMDKLGVDHPLKTIESKERQRETNNIKYGVDYPLQNADIILKYKNTNLKNLGVDNYSKSNIAKQKKLEVFYKHLTSSDRLRNRVIPLFTLEEFKGSDSKNLYRCVNCACEFLDHLSNGRVPRCPKCTNSKSMSMAELEIFEWVQSLGVTNMYHRDRKLLYPLEIDMYLPDYNLAIEFDGIYWHSELNGKDKTYHLNKTNLCKEKGVQLIHIFEDEWIDKQDIVKSIIKNKLGLVDNKIYARKCEVKDVSQEIAYNFLFEHHLQTPIYSKYNYGLYYNNELVYLVCIGAPRFDKNKKYQYELIRSCSIINTQIIGGFDKLVKHSLRRLNIKSLVSYVDRRYFNGSGYKNNWKYMRISDPSCHYMNNNYEYRESRIKYQKHKLKDLFPEHYDEKLAEWQIMQLAGYDRIWDCGNLIYEYII